VDEGDGLHPWNTGIVGSIPTRGMDVCPRFFCAVLSCVGKMPCVGLHGVLPNGPTKLTEKTEVHISEFVLAITLNP
jgi:hypothetical protein